MITLLITSSITFITVTVIKDRKDYFEHYGK